jgi:hypothetical protein
LAPIRLANLPPEVQAELRRLLEPYVIVGDYLPFTLDELKASIARDERNDKK